MDDAHALSALPHAEDPTLAATTGLAPTATAGEPRGRAERIEGDYLTGWAWIPARPDEIVHVEVFVGETMVARIAADAFRKDLLDAGIGDGRHGFMLGGVSALINAPRELVSIRFADGGGDLPNSPRWVQRRGGDLDAATTAFIRTVISDTVAAAAAPAELDPACALLTGLLAEVMDARTALSAATGLPAPSRLDQLAAGQAHGMLRELAQTLRGQYAPLSLPDADEPLVSVIIPVHNNFDFTYRCLESIIEEGAAAPFEVILVDDASTDATVLAEFVVSGAFRVVRNASNLGFLRSANAGARAARGELLFFLNNDTRVTESWLDELVRCFELHPDIGIAGSKLIYPDGSLQEAGGTVWRLGDAANWGHGADPALPRYCYLRDTDYVSGAALMIRRSRFEALGGFDERFAPAYYEDTDLCFQVREAGHRVVVQPLSRIVHHGGATCGQSADGPGAKRYQRINQRKFRQKWEKVLARHGFANHQPEYEAEHAVKRRALFIDETVPTPDRDAGSCAALAHMRLLVALGYKVTFLPASNMARIDPYTAALQRLGIECLYAPYYQSTEDAFRAMRFPPDLVYLHRHANASKYMGLVRHHFPGARIVYSVADLHFLRTRRQAEIEADEAVAARAAALETSELHAVGAADRVIVHSLEEERLLRDRVPGAAVSVVAWPVDTVALQTPLAERSGVAFVGGYAHVPNVDAARHLVSAVMPLARETLPELWTFLVGSNVPPAVAALAGPGVEVVGYVPDLRDIFSRVRCTVAPLRYGAGIKGKVLMSLAHGVPCVMSPIAAEGIDLPEALLWLVADSDAAMAEKIVALHEDDALAASLADAARSFVEARFSEVAVLRDLAAAL
ncbi:glycosyltransferase [Roseomonas sp. JC162]|uniref:Glycosyltransferase n=1 Tax=Neoroseomonas marina TaxID=1232220 RepID=A0A848EHP3_9PROT|nr:glycosyltransferase [Neoroseomonas marina]NMJ43512.1 glycosyltransferase [Neoroseomonas marina]